VKFGAIPTQRAIGAVLAHSLRLGGLQLRKGHVLTSDDVALLRAAGVVDVVVAQRGRHDLDENDAAHRLATAVAGPAIRLDAAHTGRVNLFADQAGVLALDVRAICRLNTVSEAITLATLPAFAKVRPGEMVATVKIIPFAVPGRAIQKASTVGATSLRVHPFRSLRVAVISTLVSTLKMSVVDKTLKVLDERLAGLSGSSCIADIRIPHAVDEVTEAVAHAAALSPDLIILFGGSAISDREDIIPASLVAAGGKVTHLGMPVDPGNLLMMGQLGGCPVVGAPGCARSPRRNGFDFVLERLSAGLPVGPAEIRAMSIGGLLTEIETRPQPRKGNAKSLEVDVVVLAAGRGTRMGGGKMTAMLGAKPMIRHTVEAALAASVGDVHVVVGAGSDGVRAALAGLKVQIVENPNHAEGMSTSLKAGIAAVSEEVSGAVVLLGDMPLVSPTSIQALVSGFQASPDASALVPIFEGKRGNPVLLARSLFPDVGTLQGDIGARALVSKAGRVIEIDVQDSAILLDIDTPEALKALSEPSP
jgi:molybdenum cofactor cytidylyltransferase